MDLRMLLVSVLAVVTIIAYGLFSQRHYQSASRVCFLGGGLIAAAVSWSAVRSFKLWVELSKVKEEALKIHHFYSGPSPDYVGQGFVVYWGVPLLWAIILLVWGIRMMRKRNA